MPVNPAVHPASNNNRGHANSNTLNTARDRPDLVEYEKHRVSRDDPDYTNFIDSPPPKNPNSFWVKHEYAIATVMFYTITTLVGTAAGGLLGGSIGALAGGTAGLGYPLLAMNEFI